MQFFHQFPMVRVLFPFICGIILSLQWQKDFFGWFLALAGSLFAYLVFLNRNPGQLLKSTFGVTISLILMIMGYLLGLQKQEYLLPGHYTHFQSEQMIIRITEPLGEKKKSWKTVGEVLAIQQEHRLVPVRGKILVYIAKGGDQPMPGFDETLLVHAKPSGIQASGNPGSFNYKVYLERNGIYRQLFIRQGEWKLLKRSPARSVKYYAIRLRADLLERLKQNGLSGKEYGVAAALILGQDDWLDQETRQEFSSAGVVHILGISGLHVGIIYMTLNFLLGFLNRRRAGKLLKLLLVFLLIWFYALITGLSPAALRACTMFTFVTLGQLGRRNVHIINSLAASAFLLLLFNPYLVTNIGFQFSYVAVIGIVLLQEPLSALWTSRFRLLQETWNLIVMSISAQLFTFPITLYHFHQFPVYFLPANLLVVPLSNLIIYSGMAVIGTSMVPGLSFLLGSGTSWLIKTLNWFASFFESLPYSVIEPLNLRLPELLVLYILILSGCTGYLLHRKKWLIITLIPGLVLSVLISINCVLTVRQHQLVVFSATKHSACAIIKGRNCLLMTDSTYISNPDGSLAYLMSSLSSMGVRDINQSLTTASEQRSTTSLAGIRKVPGGWVIHSGGKNFGILNSFAAGWKCSFPLQLDYLLISGNQFMRIRDIITMYQPGLIILDDNCSLRKSETREAECDELKLHCWSIRKKGAFLADLALKPG